MCVCLNAITLHYILNIVHAHAAVCLAAQRWRHQWPGAPAVPYNASITCLPVERQAKAASGSGIGSGGGIRALIFRGRRS